MLTTAVDRFVGLVPLTGSPAVHQNTNVELVVGLMLFIFAGFVIAFGGLLVGRFVRSTIRHPEKEAPYECGEPAIGDSWVQFDLRFYTVALVFIVFDVEVALLWPWAVVFKDMGAPAYWAFLVFFTLIAIPFVYEWKSGYLDWVRAIGGREWPSVLTVEDEAAGAGSGEATDDARNSETASGTQAVGAGA